MVFGSLALFVIFFLTWLFIVIFHAAAEAVHILLLLALISIVVHFIIVVCLLSYGRIRHQPEKRLRVLVRTTANR